LAPQTLEFRARGCRCADNCAAEQSLGADYRQELAAPNLADALLN